MARRRFDRPRDTSRIANDPLAGELRRFGLAVLPMAIDPLVEELPAILQHEDRRLYNAEVTTGFDREPGGARARARGVPQSSAGIEVSEPGRMMSFNFAVPPRVAICVRRKRRREVLHAIGAAGGKVRRRKRRSLWSDVRC